MSARQPDLFFGDKQPPRMVPPERAYMRPEKPRAAPYVWSSVAGWVRTLNRLFALERASGDHYERVRQTARTLTIERVRVCRHDDDLERVEAMLIDANAGWLGGGLSTAFTRAERGALLVEVRNRRQLIALGRDVPKKKDPRLDPARLPVAALDRLIQSHRDMNLVEQLRAERARRLG